MRLTDMEVFVEVAKLRGFRPAAASLGVNASTLSRRIVGLERELGIVLIRRSTRSFALTESGQEFFDRSQRLVDEVVRTREELGANFTKVSGCLRVGAPADLASTVLVPIFAKYCRENPAVSIDIVSTQGQPDLTHDSVDLAFAVAHQTLLPNSSYFVHQVGSFPRMMYASRIYLKRNGLPTRPLELQEHACIRYLANAAEKQWDLHHDGESQTITVKGACACSSVIVSAQSAREHLGIAMLPQYLATHPTFGNGLIRVLPDWEGTPVNVFAVTVDRVLPAKIRELIRLAKAGFGKRIAQLESVVNGK